MSLSDFAAGGANGAHPPVEDDDEFRELCAISTTGELTLDERGRLGSHLESCPDCRRLKSQFESVAQMVRPVERSESKHIPVRLSASHTPVFEFPVHAPAKLLKRILPLGAAAAILLLATGFAGYGFWALNHRSSEGQGSVVRQVSVSVAHQIKQPAIDNKPKQQDAKLRAASKESAALRKELGNSQQALQEAQREMGQLREERANLQSQLDGAEAEREILQGRITTLIDQGASDAIKASNDATELKDLKEAIESKNREIARAEALLNRDRDIRGLIGARDLYIAEIYDVAKNGETQKPFGRVFYTKDKSLVFYGYDLDQQKGIARDASFQVWGRRTSSQSRDFSLGLLYQDDSKQNRWVLKFNDAKTISQMDAVFVTAEPEGGSTRPTGKQLLFTYLHIDPNHP